VQKEFILAVQMVNSAYCCDILWWPHENMLILRPKLWQWNWLGSQKCTMSHFLFHHRISYQKQHECHPHHLYSPALPPMTFLFPRSKIPPFWYIWDDQGRIAGGVEHSWRPQLPECI
jgi:hypothetical protein